MQRSSKPLDAAKGRASEEDCEPQAAHHSGSHSLQPSQFKGTDEGNYGFMDDFPDWLLIGNWLVKAQPLSKLAAKPGRRRK